MGILESITELVNIFTKKRKLAIKKSINYFIIL